MLATLKKHSFVQQTETIISISYIEAAAKCALIFAHEKKQYLKLASPSHRPLKSSPECLLMEVCLPTLNCRWAKFWKRSNQASSL